MLLSAHGEGPLARVWPYAQIARVDHWFKNAFMVLGVVLALFYRPDLLTFSNATPLLVTLVATCIIASSNYVLNEILDGPKDRLHPKKRTRPVPAGKVHLGLAYLEWLALGILGIGLAFSVNALVGWSGLSLWLLGLGYNVPPIRTKEWPYLDVLSESANNAVRLLLGWFPLIVDRFPPVSLVLSYWLLGAFFMGTKRLAEYRHIANPSVAAAYRGSFAHYNEERLLLSIVFYASACSLFGGIFIVRYHLELILFVPLAAALFVHYLRLGLKPDSPTQNPEKLYRERGFVVFLVVSFLVFVVLMFSRVPVLYEWFNVEPSQISPLWTIG